MERKSAHRLPLDRPRPAPAARPGTRLIRPQIRRREVLALFVGGKVMEILCYMIMTLRHI